jgi:hypothetical protein
MGETNGDVVGRLLREVFGERDGLSVSLTRP